MLNNTYQIGGLVYYTNVFGETQTGVITEITDFPFFGFTTVYYRKEGGFVDQFRIELRKK